MLSHFVALQSQTLYFAGILCNCLQHKVARKCGQNLKTILILNFLYFFNTNFTILVMCRVSIFSADTLKTWDHPEWSFCILCMHK